MCWSALALNLAGAQPTYSLVDLSQGALERGASCQRLLAGRSMGRQRSRHPKAVKTTDPGEKASVMMTAEGLNRKTTSFGKVVLLWQVAALMLKAIAHYI